MILLTCDFRPVRFLPEKRYFVSFTLLFYYFLAFSLMYNGIGLSTPRGSGKSRLEEWYRNDCFNIPSLKVQMVTLFVIFHLSDLPLLIEIAKTQMTLNQVLT